MRALQFKIKVDTLVLYRWDDWKREDQDYIRDCARKSDVTLLYNDEEQNTVTFNGRREYLFGFLYLVAYRYDVEIA